MERRDMVRHISSQYNGAQFLSLSKTAAVLGMQPKTAKRLLDNLSVDYFRTGKEIKYFVSDIASALDKVKNLKSLDAAPCLQYGASNRRISHER